VIAQLRLQSAQQKSLKAGAARCPARMKFSAQRNEILNRGIARDQFPGFRIEWSISHWSASSWDLNL
jgi:hypothetical protein